MSIKLSTDWVKLHNKKSGHDRVTSRFYADKKVNKSPDNYEIIELCQEPQTPQEQPIPETN